MKNNNNPLSIGLLGLGVVGTGVAKSLLINNDHIESRIGRKILLKHILVNDLNKERPDFIPTNIITDNPDTILNDPSIDVIIEVIGGASTAYNSIKIALKNKKHVVTANKELIAKHGEELRAISIKHQSHLLYEASTGAGIPIINSLKTQLSGNKIESIRGIINGTSNYILTQMANSNSTFDKALKEAQDLGYAEADPANDIEGTDALYKICILANLAFGCEIKPEQVHKEGITSLEPQDFQIAKELGYSIKPLAICELSNNTITARVHPALIPNSQMLSKVDNVYNAIELEGDLAGKIVLHGEGAGQNATTSGIIGDLIEISTHDNHKSANNSNTIQIKSINDLVKKFYIRLSVTNESGVLAQISTIFGNLGISIASMIQKDDVASNNIAELIITTYESTESSIQEALIAIKDLTVVIKIHTVLRIED